MNPTRVLRDQPDLEQLKRQAKELLDAYRAAAADAVAEVNVHYHGADPATFALHHAQLVLARSYGFESWPKLKAFVDGATVHRLVDLVCAEDLDAARVMLRIRPELANMQLSYGNEHRPLHFAVMNRSAAMVQLLMEHGADPHRGIGPHRAATTALTLAIERGFDEIAAIITAEENRRVKPEQPAPETIPGGAAREAVARGDADWLRAQHAAGTLANPVDWNRGGLLTEAVRHNRPEILRMLLDFGFDPNERVHAGAVDGAVWSQAYPLFCAAGLGRVEMAEMLLLHGADPNLHVDSSGSCVHAAYSNRQAEILELFRRHGAVATPDTIAIYRETELARQMLAADPAAAAELLHFGAMGGGDEVVRLALEHIDWARDDSRWFRNLVQPLSFLHHIPWLNSIYSDLDRGAYIRCFRHILRRCGPNHVGGFGRTALHEVASMGDYIADEEVAPFAEALLDAGAKMDVRDEILRSTPLGWACRWGRLPVVRLLLDRGADPQEPDSEPWARPRAWAGNMGHGEILRLL